MDDPWFVRRRRLGRYSIDPVSRGGWLLLLGYIVLATLCTPLPLLRMPVGAFAYTGVAAALTVGFVIIAWRTSVPEAQWRGR